MVVLDGIDWRYFPIVKARRRSQIQDTSSKRVASIGDFVWYDTYIKCFIDGETAQNRSKLPRRHTEDLPTGFVHF